MMHDAIACQLQTTSQFSYCADKLNTHLPCCPHPISNSSSSLTYATTFSQPPQVEDYAAATKLPSMASSSEGQGPKTPIQGSNASGSAVTASSCANEFNTGVLLVGMGPLLPHPSCIPLQAAMTMATAATTKSH